VTFLDTPDVTAQLPEGPVTGAVRVAFVRAGQMYASTEGHGSPESITYGGRAYYVGITLDLDHGVWTVRPGESVRREVARQGTEDVTAPTIRARVIEAVKAAAVSAWTPEAVAYAEYADATRAAESLVRKREDLTRQLEDVCAELAPYMIVINRGDPRKSTKD
jgi:hypothetical protein